MMAERPSRRRIRDLHKSGRAENSSVSSTRSVHGRSRSVHFSTINLLINGRLLDALRTHGLVLPKSTPKASLIRIYKQFKNNDNSAGNSVEVMSASPGSVPSTVAQNDSAQDFDRDISALKQDLSQIQASLAEISRKISDQRPQNAISESNASTTSSGGTIESAAPLASGTVRVPVDTLPPVNIVSQNIRKLIHNHKYVNLALLLIPSVDSDSQTKIIDQDGNQIIVRANDARLQKSLTIHEFRSAISRFKNVICEKEPERRKELDTYADMIDSMFIEYGGTHFYDYHVAFARKAEQYFHLMGTKLDWASRDSSLYMQTFAGLKSATCDLCSSASHNAKFCPMSINSNRFQSLRVSSNAQPRPGQPDDNSKTDKFGRTRLFHNGKEICNNFNSTAGCTFTHITSKMLHICSVCKQPSHASTECASKGKTSGSTSQTVNPTKR